MTPTHIQTGRVFNECMQSPLSPVQFSKIGLKGWLCHTVWQGHLTTGRENSGLNIHLDWIEFGGSRIEKVVSRFLLHAITLFNLLSRVYWAISTNHLLAAISRLSLAWSDLVRNLPREFSKKLLKNLFHKMSKELFCINCSSRNIPGTIPQESIKRIS